MIKKDIKSHLWSETKWVSGALVIFLVWSGLVGSGLALVWSCGKTNQSLPVLLMKELFGIYHIATHPSCPWMTWLHDPLNTQGSKDECRCNHCKEWSARFADAVANLLYTGCAGRVTF
jgi:hypothetical protein